MELRATMELGGGRSGQLEEEDTGKCQRRPSSSELVFKIYFFRARKIPILFYEQTCTCILCICKFSQHYTFTCGVQKKDKYAL